MNTAAYEHTSCRRWTRQQYLKSIHIEQQYSVHEKHGIFSETLYILSLYIYSNRKKKKGSKKYHFYHMQLFFAVSSMLLSMVKFDNPTIFSPYILILPYFRWSDGMPVERSDEYSDAKSHRHEPVFTASVASAAPVTSAASQTNQNLILPSAVSSRPYSFHASGMGQ